MRNKSAISYRFLSEQQQTKMFVNILTDSFKYLQDNSNEFVMFLNKNKQYYKINNVDIKYTFVNSTFKGEKWKADIRYLKMSYKTMFNNGYVSMYQPLNIVNTTDLIFNFHTLEQKTEKFSNVVLKYIKNISQSSKLKLFKYYYRFKLNQTEWTFRSLWKVLNQIFNLTFNVRLQNRIYGDTQLYIWPIEEFKHYKTVLLKAHYENSRCTNLNGLTLAQIGTSDKNENTIIRNSVEDLFGNMDTEFEQYKPIKVRTVKVKKIKSVTQNCIISLINKIKSIIKNKKQ